AGGAWYLDQLTDDLARAAWTRFQAIEAGGGIVAALSSGVIAADVAASRQATETAVREGGVKLLGVTVFRNADARPVEVEAAEPVAVSGPEIRLPGPDSLCPPLAPARLSAAFEEA
ncbi:MAG TPA: methylmalonyl-CoA mutase family protein, partial [Caulobacter sp.]|nr:methylmalonyl-CoA mutase family protein [Caulobacter sp.]